MVQATATGHAVRRLLKPEVAALFRAHHEGVEVAVDMESKRVLETLGGGCQGDVFITNLRRCIVHVCPVNTFVPKSRWDVQSKEVVAGTLEVM